MNDSPVERFVIDKNLIDDIRLSGSTIREVDTGVFWAVTDSGITVAVTTTVADAHAALAAHGCRCFSVREHMAWRSLGYEAMIAEYGVAAVRDAVAESLSPMALKALFATQSVKAVFDRLRHTAKDVNTLCNEILESKKSEEQNQ